MAEPVSRRERLGWVLLLGAGTLLLSVGIGEEALWFDEGFSVALIARLPWELAELAAQDSHGPAFYAALQLWSSVFGDDLVALRAFSVVGALALAGLGPGPVRRLVGPRAAFAFSALVLVSPAVACHAQEIRMYTWAPSFTTGALVWGLLALRDDRGWDWVRLGLALVGAMHLHIFGLLGAVAVGAVLVGLALARRDLSGLRWLAGVGLVAGLLFLPRLGDLLTESTRVAGRGHWVLPLHLSQPVFALVYPFANRWEQDVRLAVPALLLCMGVVVAGLLSHRWRQPGRQEAVIAPLVAYGVVALATALVSVLVLPLYSGRYLFVVAPWLALALATLLASLDWRWSLGLGLALAALLVPVHLGRLRHHTTWPMDEVVHDLPCQDSDAFLHLDGATLSLFAWYYPRHDHYLWMPDGSWSYFVLDAWEGQVERVDDPAVLLERAQRVWVVHRGYGQNEPAFERLAERADLDWEVEHVYAPDSPSTEWPDLELGLLEPRR